MGNRNIIFRVLLGGYLAYLGITLVTDAIKDKPEHYIIFMLVGIIFTVIGGGWLIYSLRSHFKNQKKEEIEETDDTQMIEESNEEKSNTEE